MPITYATSHIDGGLDCSNLAIGLLKSMSGTSPIAKLTSNAHLTTDWPTKTEMVLPVNAETLRVARNLTSSD